MKTYTIFAALIIFMSIAFANNAKAQNYASCSNIPCADTLFSGDTVLTFVYENCEISVLVYFRKIVCPGMSDFYEFSIEGIAHDPGCPPNGTLDFEEFYQTVHKKLILSIFEMFLPEDISNGRLSTVRIYQPTCIWEQVIDTIPEMDIAETQIYYRRCVSECCIYDYDISIDKYSHVRLVLSDEISGFPPDFCDFYDNCSYNCHDALSTGQLGHLYGEEWRCPYQPNCLWPKISILSNEIEFDIQLFPIPAEDLILLQSNNTNINFENIEIFSSIGVKILESKAIERATGEYEISIASLVPGVYYLIISTEKDIIRKKFIVK